MYLSSPGTLKTKALFLTVPILQYLLPLISLNALENALMAVFASMENVSVMIISKVLIASMKCYKRVKMRTVVV